MHPQHLNKGQLPNIILVYFINYYDHNEKKKKKKHLTI